MCENNSTHPSHLTSSLLSGRTFCSTILEIVTKSGSFLSCVSSVTQHVTSTYWVKQNNTEYTSNQYLRGSCATAIQSFMPLHSCSYNPFNRQTARCSPICPLLTWFVRAVMKSIHLLHCFSFSPGKNYRYRLQNSSAHITGLKLLQSYSYYMYTLKS